MFLTPTITVPDPTGTYYAANASPASVDIRPDVISNPNNAPRTIKEWFNPAAFVAPPAGRLGNAARDTVKGPGENLWHAGLEKYIFFSDNPRVQRLRLDWYCDNVQPPEFCCSGPEPFGPHDRWSHHVHRRDRRLLHRPSRRSHHGDGGAHRVVIPIA